MVLTRNASVMGSALRKAGRQLGGWASIETSGLGEPHLCRRRAARRLPDAGRRRVGEGRRGDRGERPRQGRNACCVPQPHRTIMSGPRASVGSQSPQPHLEDGTTYYPLRPTKLDKIKNLHSTDSIDTENSGALGRLIWVHSRLLGSSVPAGEGGAVGKGVAHSLGTAQPQCMEPQLSRRQWWRQ